MLFPVANVKSVAMNSHMHADARFPFSRVVSQYKISRGSGTSVSNSFKSELVGSLICTCRGHPWRPVATLQHHTHLLLYLWRHTSTPTAKNQSRDHLWTKLTLLRTAQVKNAGYQWVTEVFNPVFIKHRFCARPCISQL